MDCFACLNVSCAITAAAAKCQSKLTDERKVGGNGSLTQRVSRQSCRQDIDPCE